MLANCQYEYYDFEEYTNLFCSFVFSSNILFKHLSQCGTALGYGSVIPDAQDAESHPSTKALGEKVGNYVEQYIEAMEKVTKSTLLLTFFMRNLWIYFSFGHE